MRLQPAGLAYTHRNMTLCPVVYLGRLQQSRECRRRIVDCRARIPYASMSLSYLRNRLSHLRAHVQSRYGH